MRKTILSAMLMTALAAPALADAYPVSGKWGESSSSEKGPIDCGGKRIVDFNGNQRTDSKGGVPTYRNKSVTQTGTGTYRAVDEFSTGQIQGAHITYTLRQVDADRLQMVMSPGGTVNLQKCK